MNAIVRQWRRPRLKVSTGPVRVCFMIDRLSRAGTETQMLALIKGLDRSRVSPFLVLLDGDDPTSPSIEPCDCPILRLKLRSLASRQAINAAVQLRSFWRMNRIEVLQTYFLDSTYLGVPIARCAGVKKVVRVRNNLGYWLTNRHRWLGAGWADSRTGRLPIAKAARRR